MSHTLIIAVSIYKNVKLGNNYITADIRRKTHVYADQKGSQPTHRVFKGKTVERKLC